MWWSRSGRERGEAHRWPKHASLQVHTPALTSSEEQGKVGETQVMESDLPSYIHVVVCNESRLQDLRTLNNTVP